MRNFRQIQRAGRTVQHGNTVEQETRSQRTEHKIFHGRFDRGDVITAQCNQCIQSQRHQFQSEVNNQHVITRDHHHLAKQRKQREHIKLAAQFATQHAALGIVFTAVDQRHADGQITEQLQQIRHRIRQKHVVKSIESLTGVEIRQGQHRADHQSQQRQVVGQHAFGIRQKHVD